MKVQRFAALDKPSRRAINPMESLDAAKRPRRKDLFEAFSFAGLQEVPIGAGSYDRAGQGKAPSRGLPGFDRDIAAAGFIKQIDVRDGAMRVGFELRNRRMDQATAIEGGDPAGRLLAARGGAGRASSRRVRGLPDPENREKSG